MVNIMQATAVNGVLGVAVTFVIISGGIDLSVGTMMTLTAVMAGLVLTNLGMPSAARHRRRHLLSGAAMGGIFRWHHRQAEDPAVHRHAGHDADCARPCAGVLRCQADLFQRHAELSVHLAGKLDLGS
jgi:hypothetical protein